MSDDLKTRDQWLARLRAEGKYPTPCLTMPNDRTEAQARVELATPSITDPNAEISRPNALR